MVMKSRVSAEAIGAADRQVVDAHDQSRVGQRGRAGGSGLRAGQRVLLRLQRRRYCSRASRSVSSKLSPALAVMGTPLPARRTVRRSPPANADKKVPRHVLRNNIRQRCDIEAPHPASRADSQRRASCEGRQQADTEAVSTAVARLPAQPYPPEGRHPLGPPLRRPVEYRQKLWRRRQVDGRDCTHRLEACWQWTLHSCGCTGSSELNTCLSQPGRCVMATSLGGSAPTRGHA